MPDDYVLHVRLQFPVWLDGGQFHRGPWSVSRWTVVSFTVDRGQFHRGPWSVSPWTVVSFTVDRGQFHGGPWSVSRWTVVSFTVERWIVVFHPLRRHQLCTRRRAIITMISLTVVSLAFYSFSLFTTSVRYFNGLPVCVTLDEYNAPLQVSSLSPVLRRSGQVLFLVARVCNCVC